MLRSFRDARLPFDARLALVLLALYLASPVDLIPDFIPVLGQVDDAVIAAAVLRYVRRRAEGGVPPSPPSALVR